MKVAIIGSRSLRVENIGSYISESTDEIVSGGARGVDNCAKEYAQKNGIKYKEFLPNYQQYGRAAPIFRNNEIIDYADVIVAFWDGKSKGTKYVIDRCEKLHKKIKVYVLKKEK